MLIGLMVFALAFILYVVIKAFRDIGFTVFETLVLLLGSIVAFRFIPDIPIYWYENTILSINVAGFLIPVIISAKMIKSGRAPFMECLVGVAVVAVIAYQLSEFIAGKGVLISNIYLPSFVAAIIGVVLSKKVWNRVGPISYVSGSMGILVGADVVRLNEILAYQSPTLTVLSIGGAGIFDAIFIAGIIAVTLGILTMPLARMTEGQR
ncbi:MAG: DUF1614 domain-containing protein [Methanosarcinales archaeon Met12]|nr:MAG: DUF1614 domain-containing protein [Methanosarcinales archaeon Met12]